MVKTSESGPLTLDPTVPRAAQSRVELDLQALVELTENLGSNPDPFRVAETSLFCLMGTMGLSRGALSAVTDEGEFVRLRNFGFEDATLDRLEDFDLLASWARARPAGVVEVSAPADPTVFEPSLHAALDADRVDIVALLPGETSVTAVMVLGGACIPRQDDHRDIFLETAIRYVGATLDNSRLQARLVERSRRLSELSERVADADRHKEEFVANVTHELRTPLTVVSSGISVVLMSETLDDEIRAILEAAERAATDLDGMIERILEFRLATRNALDVCFETFDLVALGRAYVADAYAGVVGDLRELVFRPAAEEQIVRADPVLVRRVLDALVDNATKFTPRGTRIEVTIAVQNDDVVLSVDDDGPGVAPAELEMIQRVFSQLDGSSTRRFGGMGLGLAYVRAIAREMKGRFELESEPGRGTTARLVLPRHDDATPTA